MKNSCAFIAYDTLCRIAIDYPEKGDVLLQECEHEAHNIERVLSMFDSESELSRLCTGNIPGRETKVSDTLYDFLEENIAISKLSNGAFDPTVGPLVKMWNFLADKPKVPSDDAIKSTLRQIGYQHIHLNDVNRSVFFDVQNIGLDPGAGGKGYALGVAVEQLRKAGVERAVLDYGGNLFVIGQKKESDHEGRPWKVAIRDPDNPDSAFGTVELADAGIATSSWYEHSFQKDGKIYHHLLDPRTGYPVPLTLKSVSIISSKAIYTDLISTAFFILGENEGCALVKKMRECSGEKIDYVAVREDGTVLASDDACFKPV